MIFTYIVSAHAPNRRGSVLNLDLATIVLQIACTRDELAEYYSVKGVEKLEVLNF